jgi:tetratricopeptide (TPR) repeat protein
MQTSLVSGQGSQLAKEIIGNFVLGIPIPIDTPIDIGKDIGNDAYYIARASDAYNSAMSYYNIGNNNLALIYIDKSFEYYNKIKKLASQEVYNADLSYTWSLKGGILYNLGRYEEAITCCDNAIGLSPDNKYAWNIKGLIFTKLGKEQEAIEFFDNAIAIDPNFAEAINNKNGLMGNQGQNAYSGEMPTGSTQRYGFSGTPAHDTVSSSYGFGYGGIGGIAMTKQ